MANHMKLVDDAVSAVHVARHSRDVQCLAATVAFEDRRDFRRCLACVLQSSEPQARLQSDRDLGLHVRQLFLDQLVRGKRSAELLPIEHILSRSVPAEFRGAECAPGDAVARGIEAAEDRKSTRLNSSHRCISYAVFCLKKKKLNYVHCEFLVG